jgi:hypothetical protein
VGSLDGRDGHVSKAIRLLPRLTIMHTVLNSAYIDYEKLEIRQLLLLELLQLPIDSEDLTRAADLYVNMPLSS